MILPSHEAVCAPARLAALQRTALLDSPPDEAFNRLTRLAVRALGAPISVMSLVDRDRQFFLAAEGLPEPLASQRETPLTHSFCQHVVARRESLIVSDARLAPLLRDNPAVADLGIVAYAGVPLRSPDGEVLGSLAILAMEPRDWSSEDIRTLEELSALATGELALRDAAREARDAAEVIARQNRVLTLVVADAPLSEVLYALASEAEVAVTGSLCSVLLVDRASNTLQPGVSPSLPPDYWKLVHSIPIAPELGSCGSAAFLGEPVNVEDIATDPKWEYPRALALSHGLRACWSVPIRGSDNTVLGTFAFYHRYLWCPSAADMAVAAEMTSVASLVIERVRVTAALRESEQRHSMVARATNDVIWESDLTSKMLSWSDAVTSVFGHANTSDTQSVSWWSAHVHPADRARVLGIIEDALAGAGSDWQAEYRFRRADGSYATVIDRAYIARDGAGQPVRMVGAMTDLTHRAEAEAANRFQAHLLDAVEQAIIATDTDGRVTYWSKSAERLYGWTAAEAMGMDALQVIPGPELVEKAASLFDQVAGGASWAGEFTMQRQDGSPVITHVSSAPLHGEDGAVIGIVSVSSDISARLLLEEQFRQAQKMEVVGQLAGGIAHDFNNLLTVIMGHAELLLEQLGTADSRYDGVREIRKAAARAAALTRQLLAFSRKQILQPRDFDLNETIRDAQRMLVRLIGEDIRVETTLSASQACVRADPGQIEQVLVNLALNARDAMVTGGTITIGTALVEITATTLSGVPDRVTPGAYVRLSVRDTGCGMSPAVQARIFEPFFTTKPLGKGTGLGLSTLFGIVTQSGGFVQVSSEAGLGALFSVYLPEARNAVRASAMTETVSPAQNNRGSETVLLVEDESAVRTYARRILEKNGYHVIEAFNGRDGLEKAKQHTGHLDLLLTDAVMPEMGGPELAVALGLLRPELPVVFMTGYSDDDMLRRGFDASAPAMVSKPFPAQVLLNAVRNALDGKAVA
jgi:two-component system cell cycle sensor histidine kinase/response regulator CckA